jgi:hypothetical protein
MVPLVKAAEICARLRTSDLPVKSDGGRGRSFLAPVSE